MWHPSTHLRSLRAGSNELVPFPVSCKRKGKVKSKIKSKIKIKIKINIWIKVKINFKVKGSGQKCPLYTCAQVRG